LGKQERIISRASPIGLSDQLLPSLSSWRSNPREKASSKGKMIPLYWEEGEVKPKKEIPRTAASYLGFQ